MTVTTGSKAYEDEAANSGAAIRGRVTRAIRIVGLIQSGQARSVGSLADQLGVSRRTVFRDIRTLRDAGVPIESELGKGYAVTDGTQVPGLHLSKDEASALVSLVELASQTNDHAPELKAAITALRRAITQLPADEREEYRRRLRCVHTGDVGHSTAPQDGPR
ncbi:MAG: HTH domain-containing protein [bacterium]|nr:HTH domain-containing protein [bacterium]